MAEKIRVVPGICRNYERNGECHALPYVPGVGIVNDPSLVEYGTGGPNFLVNRDAWCKARHGTAEWQKKKLSRELQVTQQFCDRYEEGWPRYTDGQSLYDKNGQWIRDIDENGNWVINDLGKGEPNMFDPGIDPEDL